MTVIRDTGAAVSAVAKHLAKPSDYTGKKLSVQLADPSHENSYDTAFVNIDSKFVRGRIEVILIPGLDGVLLGNEVKFVDNSKHPVSLHGEECVQMKRVHTRARIKAKEKPDYEKSFVLQTDASDHGLGAVLCQDKGLGLQPIACASKKLVGAATRYSTIEKECLAIVWGIRKFEPYLYGKQFIIQTDHAPLQYLNQYKTHNKKLMRWALQLEEFDFVVQHIPGRENACADFLSRHAL